MKTTLSEQYNYTFGTVFILCLIISLIAACEKKPQSKGVYEVTYVVFYPGNADTVTVQLESNRPFEVRCNRGNNYMRSYSGKHYLSTSAPIKIISQRKIK